MPMARMTGKTALCRRPNTWRRPIRATKPKTSGVTGKVLQARWEVSIRTSARSREVDVVRVGVKSGRDVNETMRSDRTTVVAGMGQVRGASLDKSKSGALTASAVKREAVKEKAVDDTESERANARTEKGEIDLVVKTANHVREASRENLEKASLTAVRAMTVVHLDRDEKSATDAAEVETEVP